MIKKMELRHPIWIRLCHWSNAIAIIMLCLTGFYIHAPQAFPLFEKMSNARTLHFGMAYLLLFTLVIRIYLGAFTGDWRNLIYQPIKDTKKLPSMIKYYLFLAKDHPFYGKYNPGQKAMYTAIPVLIIVQIVTGFILYKPLLFTGAAGVLGGYLAVRLVHYIVTWIFVLMILIHVYLDVAEGLPVLKSIFTGKIPADFHHGYHVDDEGKRIKIDEKGVGA